MNNTDVETVFDILTEDDGDIVALMQFEYGEEPYWSSVSRAKVRNMNLLLDSKNHYIRIVIKRTCIDNTGVRHYPCTIINGEPT